MTTLYRPTLIESVEQAEALPEDTVVIRPGYFACEKVLGVWRNTDAAVLVNADMIGGAALVPIEAEEETMWEDSAYFQTQTRLVTPWEEA